MLLVFIKHDKSNKITKQYTYRKTSAGMKEDEESEKPMEVPFLNENKENSKMF